MPDRDAIPSRAVSLVAPDLNARLRTRHLPAAALDPEETPCFVDIIFAFDHDDRVIPRPEGFVGWWPSWDDGFGDLTTTADVESRRRLGWREDEDVVFADLSPPRRRRLSGRASSSPAARPGCAGRDRGAGPGGD